MFMRKRATRAPPKQHNVKLTPLFPTLVIQPSRKKPLFESQAINLRSVPSSQSTRVSNHPTIPEVFSERRSRPSNATSTRPRLRVAQPHHTKIRLAGSKQANFKTKLLKPSRRSKFRSFKSTEFVDNSDSSNDEEMPRHRANALATPERSSQSHNGVKRPRTGASTHGTKRRKASEAPSQQGDEAPGRSHSMSDLSSTRSDEEMEDLTEEEVEKPSTIKAQKAKKVSRRIVEAYGKRASEVQRLIEELNQQRQTSDVDSDTKLAKATLDEGKVRLRDLVLESRGGVVSALAAWLQVSFRVSEPDLRQGFEEITQIMKPTSSERI